MLLANCNLAVCPHCGKKKELISLMSGNTFSSRSWSDCKTIYPMLRQPSPVQKCPHCGKFYLLSDVKMLEGDDTSFEEGWLSFEDAVSACRQLYVDGDKKADEKFKLLVLMIIWSYNDIYRTVHTPTPEQFDVFKQFVLQAISKRTFDDNPLLVAELYREIGMFDECLQYLADFKTDDEYLNTIRKKIIASAEQKDLKVFILDDNC